MKQEVIITNNNLLLHSSGHNDLLVLKQWKGALNPQPSQNNDLGLRARSLFLRRPWNSGIILYSGLEIKKIVRSPFGDQLEKYSRQMQIFSRKFVKCK